MREPGQTSLIFQTKKQVSKQQRPQRQQRSRGRHAVVWLTACCFLHHPPTLMPQVTRVSRRSGWAMGSYSFYPSDWSRDGQMTQPAQCGSPSFKKKKKSECLAGVGRKINLIPPGSYKLWAHSCRQPQFNLEYKRGCNERSWHPERCREGLQMKPSGGILNCTSWLWVCKPMNPFYFFNLIQVGSMSLVTKRVLNNTKA